MQQFPFASLKQNRADNWLGFPSLPNLGKVHLNPIHEDHIALSGITSGDQYVFVLYRAMKYFLIICFIYFLTSVLFKDLYQST